MHNRSEAPGYLSRALAALKRGPRTYPSEAVPSIQLHFAPNDALIVNHAAVVRIIEYTDSCATLEVRDGSENPPIAITIGPQWSDVLQDVRVRHRGTFVNEKCQPARRVRIEFRYPPSVDIRMHSFAGVRVRGAMPF